MDSADNSAIMTIDLSRGRFRVHKSTLNKMGRPQYIQFLVNPEEISQMNLVLNVHILNTAIQNSENVPA